MKKQNNIYIYDNSFLSLLNLIFFLINNKIVPGNIKKSDYESNLFDNVINLSIPTSYDYNYFKKIISEDTLKTVFFVYLSTDTNSELIIFYYLLNYFKFRYKLIYMRNLKCVDKALGLSKTVSREAHRFKGFTRFRELAGEIMYAEINPTNNILFILSWHFQKRLKNEFWIIKDINRKIISIYDKKHFYILDENEFNITNLIVSNNERYNEELWKTFYKAIGIEERKNDRCRMNFMPKKYWKYITEMSEEYEKSS